jgi:hypothetical protein
VESVISIRTPIRGAAVIRSVQGMNQLPNLIIALAVIAWVVSRQLSTQPVDERKMYVLPLILAAAGISQAGLIDPHHQALGTGLLAVESVVALGLGLLRAATVRIWRDESGMLWRRGTWLTAGAWLLSLTARIALMGAGYVLGVKSGSGGVLLFLGISLLAQNAIVAWRARSLPVGAAARWGARATVQG